MKKYIYIGVGGTLGAILRFIIKNIEIYNYKEVFPINTFLINITGSFILAFIISDLVMRLNVKSKTVIEDLTCNRRKKIRRKLLF